MPAVVRKLFEATETPFYGLCIATVMDLHSWENARSSLDQFSVFHVGTLQNLRSASDVEKFLTMAGDNEDDDSHLMGASDDVKGIFEANETAFYTLEEMMSENFMYLLFVEAGTAK